MIIKDIYQKINFFKTSLLAPRSLGEVGSETVDFDKDGNVVRFSPLRRLFLVLVIVLVALLSFGIGRLSGEGDRKPVSIQGVALDKSVNNSASAILGVHGVFASSKGKKYYYPGCSNTISEANKVTFATAEMAESAGYTLASNCSPK